MMRESKSSKRSARFQAGALAATLLLGLLVAPSIATPRPLLSCGLILQDLGRGGAGGARDGGEEQDRLAARMAHQASAGQAAESIAANPPEPFKERYWGYLVLGAAAFAFMASVIIALVVSLRVKGRVQKQVEVSEQRLELALRGGDLGLWDWNVATGDVYFNDRMWSMLGYAPDEFKPHVDSWAALVHPEDMPRVMEELNAHLEGRSPHYSSEHRLKTRSGEWLWILDRGKVVERDAHGRALRAVGTHQDINPTRQAQEALAEAEQRYREMVEQAPIAIFEATPQGRFRRVNSRYASYLGYSTPEEMCSDITDIARQVYVNPAHREEYKRRLSQEGQVINFESQLKRRDGTPFWASMNTRVRRDKAGDIISYEGFLTDITERKHAEEELKRLSSDLERQVAERTRQLEESNQRLKELDQLKTSFLSSASHELRTPLTAIMGFAKVTARTFSKHFHCQAQPELAAKADVVAENLRIIFSEGERLTRLINDLLDINKIESGQVEWRDAPTPASQVLLDAAGTISGQAERTPGLEFIVDVPSLLPAIVVDRDKLLQVVLNLLNNAVKFTGAGQVRLSAHVVDSAWLEIRVTDTGPGVPAEDLERIFEKFYQGQPEAHAEDKPKGTGLGLTICRQIVTHYRGLIWAEPAPGRGLCCVVRLPLAPAAAQPA